MRNCFSVAQMRELARARLPRAVFDFIDGGAERELTLRANEADYHPLRFKPRVLVDVDRVDLGTTLLGDSIKAPLLICPMGLNALAHPTGDLGLVNAAAEKGLPFVLSTVASCSIERVATQDAGLRWFQLYFMRNRELTEGFIGRARDAGYRALVMTVDLPRGGKREKDLVNGFTVPPRVTLGNLADMLAHPRWLLRNGPRMRQLTMANLASVPGAGNDIMALSHFMNTQMDASVTWQDLAWVREQWDLPLLLKGVLNPEDAARAVDLGVDGIIVSNHGGRQLDGAPSTISALPGIAEAVGGGAEIILDGGIRRGSDIVKALALGARACGIGKAALYGLAAGGQAGVERVLEILMQEMELTLAMLGRPSITELDREALQPLSAVVSQPDQA